MLRADLRRSVAHPRRTRTHAAMRCPCTQVYTLFAAQLRAGVPENMSNLATLVPSTDAVGNLTLAFLGNATTPGQLVNQTVSRITNR